MACKIFNNRRSQRFDHPVNFRLANFANQLCTAEYLNKSNIHVGHIKKSTGLAILPPIPPKPRTNCDPS